MAAVELRLLVCDTNRVHGRLADISLLPRIYPDLKFHPLRVMPGTGGEIQLHFDRAGDPFPLADWLSQSFLVPGSGEITLRELIRTLCEQDGGAHVDPRFHSPLLRWPGRAQAIAAIGEYVVGEMGEWGAASGRSGNQAIG